MVLSMSSRDRFNALLEQWILPEYRMPLLCVYSINAFLFVAKIVLGNIIGEFTHSHSNVRNKIYYNPIQIMFTNFIPLFLPFFVSMILQRINTSRDGTNNN